MVDFFKVIIVAVFVCFSGPVSAEHLWRDGEFRGTVILTITGNLELPTRSGSSADVDKLFFHNDIAFEKAAQFDVASLQALPQVLVRADFPKGGQIYAFEGPLLEDVLDAVAAEGDTVTIRALDGYTVEIPLVDAYDMGAVVALKRDGIPFAIGDFGPTHIVFPRAERVELASMSDDWWGWSIYLMHVK